MGRKGIFTGTPSKNIVSSGTLHKYSISFQFKNRKEQINWPVKS